MVLSRIMKKIQEKSPLKYPSVREIAFLDPSNVTRDPEWCKRKMKSLVQRFLQDRQLTGGVLAGRNVKGIVSKSRFSTALCMFA